jgi:hypothetical protein
MALQTYAGPQTQVFPHLRALDGVPGTLVLVPGESYDFSKEPEGYSKPPGPSWWWKPAEPPGDSPPGRSAPGVDVSVDLPTASLAAAGTAGTPAAKDGTSEKAEG